MGELIKATTQLVYINNSIVLNVFMISFGSEGGCIPLSAIFSSPIPICNSIILNHVLCVLVRISKSVLRLPLE